MTTTPAPTAEPGTQVLLIPLADIRPDPENPRSSLGDLTDLAASVKELGILQALTVTPTNGAFDQPWQLIAGHRRLGAADLAGLEVVPCTIRADLALGSDQAVIAQIVENVHRKDLNPVEEARGYQRLVDLKLSQRKIAEKVGYKQAHVSKRLKLLKLGEAEIADLESGDLTIAAGLALADLVDHPAQHTRDARKAMDLGTAPAEAVKAQLLAIERAARIAETTEALTAKGTTVITWPRGGLWGSSWRILATSAKKLLDDLGEDLVHEPGDVRQALRDDWMQIKATEAAVKKAGHLAAVVTPTGHALLVCTKPDVHKPKPPKPKPPTVADKAAQAERDARLAEQAEAVQLRREAAERDRAAAAAAAEFAQARLFPIDAGPVTEVPADENEATMPVAQPLVRMLALGVLENLDEEVDSTDGDARLLAVLGITVAPDGMGGQPWTATETWLRDIAPTLPTPQLLAAAAAVTTWRATSSGGRWSDATGRSVRDWLHARGYTEVDDDGGLGKLQRLMAGEDASEAQPEPAGAVS